MNTNKLGKRQRLILKAIADACSPRCIHPGESLRVIPLRATHLPDIFKSDGDQRRFLEILERRGFITIERRYFLRITERGKNLMDGGGEC